MSALEQQLRDRAQDAGVQAWVCARRLGGPPAQVGLDAGEAVPMASLYKLPLAYFWADHVGAGLISFDERITLDNVDRAPGPTGISALEDSVDISQRDLVRMMISLSDNAAAEALLARAGLDRLASWLDQLPLPSTSVRRGSAESWQIIARQTGGGPTAAAPVRLADIDSDVATTEYDPALASATSAADMCQLLAGLWQASDPAHEVVRDAMRHQAWRHRIGSGFPHDDVVIAGKTGTLGRLRHEVAVVEYPNEVPIAIAVLTSAARAEIHQPAVDRAIGELARLAVGNIRLQQ